MIDIKQQGCLVWPPLIDGGLAGAGALGHRLNGKPGNAGFSHDGFGRHQNGGLGLGAAAGADGTAAVFGFRLWRTHGHNIGQFGTEEKDLNETCRSVT
ncbi:hypothetical protein [Devosia sp. J2-20]|uniref:hypothetical protein n=1 Tax=Devosia sp. J2-20 TaxID=3026161 RepID=UPI0032B80151